jgi:small subunit ribosomal protein S21
MPVVKVREDESLENALRRFKRKCEKSGVLTELARKKLLKRLAQERKMEGL